MVFTASVLRPLFSRPIDGVFRRAGIDGVLRRAGIDGVLRRARIAGDRPVRAETGPRGGLPR
jgi:hypothetical protein